MHTRPRSPNDCGAPYAIAFAAGGMLAVVYLVVRHLHSQYIGCAGIDFGCGGAVSDLFFGIGSLIVGFLVALGWLAAAVIAPSMLNQLRPQTSGWWRGLVTTGICIAVTVLIIVIYGGILTHPDWG